MAFLIFCMLWSCEVVLLLVDLLDLLLRKSTVGSLDGASNWMVETCLHLHGMMMHGDVNLGRPPCDVIPRKTRSLLK
jgi:hypothetical protein